MEIDAENLPEKRAELVLLVERMIRDNNEYKNKNESLANDNLKLEKDNEKLGIDNLKLANDNLWLNEQLKARNRRIFGRSSEKLSAEEMNGWLFDELEVTVTEEKPEVEEETIEVPARARKKPGRRPLPSTLPRRKELHDLCAPEKSCSCCGKERPRIGEDVTEELEYVPAQLYVKRHVYPKYGPCGCKKNKAGVNTRTVVSAPYLKRLIPGGLAGPGLLAHLATCKFADGLPFYRMEKILERYGVEYPRATMCNQMISVSRACQDVLGLMWEDARSSPLLHLDETTVQVLNEPGREASQKSYMWVTVGYYEGKKVILFHYHPTRSGEVAKRLTEGYQGYIQTDGYAAYNAVGKQKGITHVGCWAHVRRKFFDAKGNSESPGLAKQALSMIGKLFTIDKKLLSLEGKISAAEFVRTRRFRSLPVLKKFKTWVDMHIDEVAPSLDLGRAMAYVRSQWPQLTRYLEQAYIRPDNNAVENAIRPFVIGRKNWLFANTPLGAHASAALYSLIETAKANSLDPYSYLKFLFERIPAATRGDLPALLPHRVDRKSFNSR
jgi:transposase